MLVKLKELRSLVKDAYSEFAREPADRQQRIRAFNKIDRAEVILEASCFHQEFQAPDPLPPSWNQLRITIDDLRSSMDSVFNNCANQSLIERWRGLRTAFRPASFKATEAIAVNDTNDPHARVIQAFQVVEDALNETARDPALDAVSARLEPLLLFMQGYRRQKASGGGEGGVLRSPVAVATADLEFDLWIACLCQSLRPRLLPLNVPNSCIVKKQISLFSRLATWLLLLCDKRGPDPRLAHHLIRRVLKDSSPDGNQLKQLVTLMERHRDTSVFAGSWLSFNGKSRTNDSAGEDEGITDEYTIEERKPIFRDLRSVPLHLLRAQASVCASVAGKFGPQHRLAATSAVMALVDRPVWSRTAAQQLAGEPRRTSRKNLMTEFVKRMVPMVQGLYVPWPLQKNEWLEILGQVFSKDMGKDFRSKGAKGNKGCDNRIYGGHLTEFIEAQISEQPVLPDTYKEPLRRLYCLAINGTSRDRANVHLLQLLLHLPSAACQHAELQPFRQQVLDPLLNWQPTSSGFETQT